MVFLDQNCVALVVSKKEVVSKMCRAGQEKGLLSHTKISSSEYELESKTSTGSALPLYISSPLTLLLLSLSLPSTIFPSFYKMSQHDLHAII